MKDLFHHLVYLQRKMVQKTRKENQADVKSQSEKHSENEEAFALLPLKKKEKRKI
jgi:hypothetical protein